MTTPVRIGPEFLVNTVTDGDQGVSGLGESGQTLALSIAALNNGGFVVTWADHSGSGGDTSGSAVRGQVFAADGSPTGGEFLVNTTTGSGQTSPSVAALSTGGFVVTWTDQSGSGGDTSGSAVRGEVFAADGSPAGVEFLVNTTTADDQYWPGVAALSTGGFVVTWTDQSGSGGDTSGSAVRGRVFAADGSSTGGEFLVNTTTGSGQTSPSVAALSTGGFVVTWTDQSGSGGDTSGSAVRGQVFAADGSRIGGEFLVNTMTGGNQVSPSVAALSAGGFVVTWEDYSQTGGDLSGAAVRGQVFAADGSRIGGEFLVNTTTDSGQTSPSVAALSTGGFVVTWEDYSETGGDLSGAAVRGQAFLADGSKSGDEFLVNDATLGEQWGPRTAALGDGGFVVAWVHADAFASRPGGIGSTRASLTATDTSGTRVRAQIFHPTGLSVAATDADKAEGNGGTTPFTFTVTRSGDTAGASSADYGVAGSGGSAASAADFQGGAFPTGTVSFAAGETSKTVTVAVAGDTGVETDEGFTVTLSNPAGAAIATATAAGTIRNDDQPPPDTGGGGGGDIPPPSDTRRTVPASGVGDAVLGMLGSHVTDPAERESLAAAIAGYTPPPPATGMVTVRAVTPRPLGAAAPGGPVVIAVESAGEALVIDARGLPPGSALQSDGAGLVALLGPVTLATGAGAQYAVGGAGSQALALGEGDDTGWGGLGGDALYGNQGADALYGNLGDDTLEGGAGADALTGGAGADVFRFAAAADGGDTVTDFETGVDRIAVAGPNFGLRTAGALPAAHFALDNPTAADAAFVFNTRTGVLSFDADGAGAGAAVAIATLNVRTLSAGDILVLAA